MIPLKTLIVENEDHILKELQYYLDSKPYNSIVSVTKTVKNCSDTIDIILEESFQISMLDIELPDGTCFDLLEKLPRESFGEIVFCTEFGGKYLEKLISAKPIYYLSKPYSKIKIQEMTIAIEAFFKTKSNSQHFLELFRNYTGKKVIVDKKDIIYIEAKNDQSVFYFPTGDGKYIEAIDPRPLIKQLERLDSKFVQCNRWQIINVDFLKDGESNKEKESFIAFMPNGLNVEISRAFKDVVFARKGIR